MPAMEAKSSVQQAAPNESEDLSRGLIEPVRVIQDAQQRLLGGGLRQQAEHGEGDQKSVGFVSDAESQCNGERPPLRLGEHSEATQHRSEQLMQPRESQFHLRFDTNTAGHSDTGCP